MSESAQILPEMRRYKPMVIVGSYDELSRMVTELTVASIAEEHAAGRPHVLGIATGQSFRGPYQGIEDAVKDGRITWREDDWFSQLDEYAIADLSDPRSYTSEQSNLLKSWGVNPKQLIIPPGDFVTQDELIRRCRAIDRKIKRLGYAKLAYAGVGTLGHVAFLEAFKTTVRAMRDFIKRGTGFQRLCDRTKQDNARYWSPDSVKDFAVTQGPATILNARWLVVFANSESKGPAIHHGIEGAVCGEWPVSIMQLHPRAIAFVQTDAARSLSNVQISEWPGAQEILSRQFAMPQ